jgi:hypothetical protein
MLDFERIPQSKGISANTLVAIGIVVAMIFGVGAYTIYCAGSGHMWPANQTMRADLGKMPSQIQ